MQKARLRHIRWKLVVVVMVTMYCATTLAQDSANSLDGGQVITSENAGRITELANLGTGAFGLPFWAESNEQFYFASSAGTWEYSLNDLAHPIKLMVDQAPQPPSFVTSYATPDPAIPITTNPDGHYAIYQYSGEVSGTIRLGVEDKEAGQIVSYLKADEPNTMRSYSGILFAPHFVGDILFYLRDNTLYRWQSATHHEERLIDKVPDVFISPNGEYAITSYLIPVVSGEVTFEVYDLQPSPASQIFSQTIPATDRWHSLAFAPDGKHVATGGNAANTRIWDFSRNDMAYVDDKPPDEFQEDAVVDLAYSPDGKYLAGCVNSVGYGHAFLREAATEKDVAIIHGADSALFCGSAAFHPTDNTVAFGEEDGSIRIWNIDNLISRHEIDADDEPRTFSGQSQIISDLSFSNDGTKLASASWDHSVHVWDYKAGKTISTISLKSAAWSVAFNPQGNLLATGEDNGSLHLWDFERNVNVSLGSSSVENDFVSDLAFNKDGSVLASSWIHGDIKLWNVDRGDLLANFNGGDRLFHIAFNPQGTLLASASHDDTTVRLWGISPQ